MGSVSLAILVILLALSVWKKLNIGWLGIISGFALGIWGLGEHGSDTMLRFPSDLFLTLLGICFFFSILEANGTMERIFSRMQSLVRCNRRSFPWFFFGLACTIATIGAGNIAAAALLAPLAAMSTKRYRMSPFLMTIMIANGANAGALSPLAPAGIVTALKMRQLGLEADIWPIYFYSLLVQSLCALSVYLAMGVFRENGLLEKEHERIPWQKEQIVSAGVLALIVIAALFSDVSIGIWMITAAVILIVLFPKHEADLLKSLPWNILIMVCGFSLFVSVLQAAGGIRLLANWMSGLIAPFWFPGSLAFLSGAVSSFTSSTAVVLPTFLPLIPDLLTQGTDNSSFDLAASIAIGSHLVDASPLSTIGALCVAATTEGADREELFQKTLKWGLGMIPVSGVICQLLFGIF